MAKTGYESLKMSFVLIREDVVTASATELTWNSNWDTFDDERNNTCIGGGR